MDKLQFLVLIFAVLLSELCNMTLYNYKIYLSSFLILKIAALRHDIRLLKIKKKIELYVRRSGARDQYASLCQISSKSVKRLQRYSELTVLEMVAVRHLGFLKFKFLNDRNGEETCSASSY